MMRKQEEAENETMLSILASSQAPVDAKTG
jgi:hypothetical protein